jgi:hypothetical protein
MNIMKKRSITFVIERPKSRAHYVLFDNSKPFKHKVINSKNNYKRHAKFCNDMFYMD